jgi:hypothetical protein
MDKDKARRTAIALWQLAFAFRSGQDKKLWAIGDACDKQAMRYAKEAGVEFSEVEDEVNVTDIDTEAWI